MFQRRIEFNHVDASKAAGWPLLPSLIGAALLALVAGCGSDSPPSSTIEQPGNGVDIAVAGAQPGAAGDAPLLPPGTSLTADGGLVCQGESCASSDLPLLLCGNGVVDDFEGCDDGNVQPGDGCSSICRPEPNFACSTPGEACVSTISCGDGQVSGGEACDDANTAPGDGCAPECSVEVGFSCTAQGCVPVAEGSCGDGAVNAGETCDDGLTAAGDGCSATCQVEPGFTCAVPGEPCRANEFCGNGIQSDAEACDDGNTNLNDGCNGACGVERFFVCPTPGQPCRSTIVCGDGLVTGNEPCDDGNTVPNDGCAANCKSTEPGFTCPTTNGVGGLCTVVIGERCGDGLLSQVEFCDDGNLNPDDGCTADCAVSPGFDCPAPGTLCGPVRFCGDGLLDGSEGCDDGNDAGGDGCGVDCRKEPNFACPVPGSPCVSTIRCNDGIINGSETCDDQNDVAGDGCNRCALEPGFVCPQGAICRAVCGDGIRAGREQCDDGNPAGNDGCGATCRLEDGFKCDDPRPPALGEAPDVCARTTCGRFGAEGTEQCDDGNAVPYDGCFECRREPTCRYNAQNRYECGSVCGDGMKFPNEACDDGNTLDGDGCSRTCQVEFAFTCLDQLATASSVDLPIIYRDFRADHPQFEVDPGNGFRTPGMVLAAIGTNGKPAYNPGFSFNGRAWTLDGAKLATGAATLANDTLIGQRFAEWYTTDITAPIDNQQLLGFLPLTEVEPGTFQFSAALEEGLQFFPLDGLGFGNQSVVGGVSHNFHFTSEVRQWFVFNPASTPTLTFRGDDDVWVFVNGQLTVDLGGIHSQFTGRIVLNGNNSQLCVGATAADNVDDFVAPPATNALCSTVSVPLGPSDVNEIAVFQAERHVTESNYTLTLQGFQAPVSLCQSQCGDGRLASDEACDLGAARNTGAYGTCNPDCSLAPFCGDGREQAPQEECDDGVNRSLYGGAASVCGPNCQIAPFCGDATVDGANGERCDAGAANANVYNSPCQTNCQLGPRCGDGEVQTRNGEQCDKAAQNGASSSDCTAACRLKCGNAVLDQGETCDAGAANANVYDSPCRTNCQLGPRCGDAVVQVEEQCDDGLNDGSYGTCAPGCVPGPRCGDGTVQAAGNEACDRGSANLASNLASAYGPGLCTTQCLPAPFCGDHAVNVERGERCDDGVNDGSPGSCTSTCSAPVPLPSCGDGRIDTGEECDSGANNGSATSTCDGRCRRRCGNGALEPGEECDDGVNDGSYGTCNANCTFAPFCGDGVRQPNNELCDRGPMNVSSSAYGPGLCAACVPAPFCGDGRVDDKFNEACDGGPGCSVACTLIR